MTGGPVWRGHFLYYYIPKHKKMEEIMFGRKKYDGECEGRYTGEGVIDARRFNESNGTTPTEGIQVQAYVLTASVHASGNMRYPVYEYTVNGITYRRARTGISYNSGHVSKMKDKPCKVLYETENPGNSKVK